MVCLVPQAQQTRSFLVKRRCRTSALRRALFQRRGGTRQYAAQLLPYPEFLTAAKLLTHGTRFPACCCQGLDIINGPSMAQDSLEAQDTEAQHSTVLPSKLQHPRALWPWTTRNCPMIGKRQMWQPGLWETVCGYILSDRFHWAIQLALGIRISREAPQKFVQIP